MFTRFPPTIPLTSLPYPLIPFFVFFPLTTSVPKLYHPPWTNLGLYQPMLPVGNSHLSTPLLVDTYFLLLDVDRSRWMETSFGHEIDVDDDGMIGRNGRRSVLVLIWRKNYSVELLISFTITQITPIKCAECGKHRLISISHLMFVFIFFLSAEIVSHWEGRGCDKKSDGTTLKVIS